MTYMNESIESMYITIDDLNTFEKCCTQLSQMNYPYNYTEEGTRLFKESQQLLNKIEHSTNTEDRFVFIRSFIKSKKRQQRLDVYSNDTDIQEAARILCSMSRI